MEFKFKKIREELDELGYYQTFTPESSPLVEKLVADLKTTTESLQKYMKIAQNAIEDRDSLQLGAEPYKCDNARLVKECNDLHLTLLQYKEQNEKIQKDLKRRLELFKAENSDCNLEKEKLKKHIRQLEAELVSQGEILQNPKHKGKTNLKSASAGAFFAEKNCRKTKSFELNSAMALADQKVVQLSKELKKVKEQNLQLIETNEVLQYQLGNRDKEIKRLNAMLEGGRPLQALKKDCCCKSSLTTEATLAVHEELTKALQEKEALESRLKESLAKQHEAMTRALHLAERNKILEKEMKDIDHLALAVEAECNNTVKSNAEKVNHLQDQVNQSLIKIQNLERDNARLKEEKEDLNAELNAIGVEKKHLQTVLETSLEDKKRLQDRINNFTIIENDLNMEIDRLTRMSGEQKSKIAELEAHLKSGKDDRLRSLDEDSIQKIVNRISSSTTSPTRAKSKSKKKTAPKRSSKDESPMLLPPPAALQVPTNTPHDTSESGRRCQCCCDACSSTKHLKELLEKELQHKDEQANKCIDSLRSEKEYYMKEYHKILEQLKNLPIRPSSNGKSDQLAGLTQKLAEKEQILASLQHENKMLSQEKFNLMSRLNSVQDMPDSNIDGPCLKATCKRTERERDLLRADLEKVEEERDALKEKLRGMSDSKINEQERLQKRLMEAEDQVHKLEQECRELVQSQGSRRATINTLEEQCDSIKDQLRATQNELSQQRALYNQLKTLHEQTDLSLSDTQNKLMQAETELASALETLKRRDLDRGTVSKEVDLLKNDLHIMKSQLAEIDREKDELLITLDDKTEKMAMLEGELRTREKRISSLEATVTELKKKLNMAIDESTNQEHELRNSQTELATLRQELDTTRKIKDGAIQENRRLQDDLCSVTCDCRDARKELELYKRQVDDLKTQLQHYVAEIKRTEDLISNKEIERNELLDQFRSLSHEANILESNNHTLENEASQTRVQLSVALDHASDLERKLENKDSIILSYEKQIADLTSQIASLEIQLRQFVSQFERTDTELEKMREKCIKLETENAKYKRQVKDKDDQRYQTDRSADQLRSERELLQQQTASRDRRAVENVEGELHDAKHEINDLRLLNQDLQEEVQRLKIQIQDLRDKLRHCICDEKPGRSPSVRSGQMDAARTSKTDLVNSSFVSNKMTKLSNLGSYDRNKPERGSISGSQAGKRCSCLDIRKNVDDRRRPLSDIQEVCCDKCCCDVSRNAVVGSSRVNRNEDAGSDISIESYVRINRPSVQSHVANYTSVCESHGVKAPKSYFDK